MQIQQRQHPERWCHCPLLGTACQSADSFVLMCLRFPVTPDGSRSQLRAHARTACLATSTPFPSVSLAFNFCIFICPPWSHWLCFSSQSPPAFLAVSPASVDCAYSFVIPGTGDTEQSCVSNQCWAPRQAWPRLQFKVAGPVLDAGGCRLPELFIMSPGLRSFSQYLTFFSALLFVLPPLS